MAKLPKSHHALSNAANLAAACASTARWKVAADRIRPRETVEVVAYGVWYQHGGSEEGGWGYDAGRVLGVIRCRVPRVEQAALRLIRALAWDSDYGRTSVLGGEDFEIRVESRGRRSFSTRTRYYE